MNNQHVTSVGQRKNLSPGQDSNLWPPKHRAGALSTELRVLYPQSNGCSIHWATGALSSELRVLYPLSYGRSILWVLRSSVNRAPARCLGGHRFESCPGLRFFVCPALVKWWLFYLHIHIYIYCSYGHWLNSIRIQLLIVHTRSYIMLNNGKILLCDKYILTSTK